MDADCGSSASCGESGCVCNAMFTGDGKNCGMLRLTDEGTSDIVSTYTSNIHFSVSGFVISLFLVRFRLNKACVFAQYFIEQKTWYCI